MCRIKIHFFELCGGSVPTVMCGTGAILIPTKINREIQRNTSTPWHWMKLCIRCKARHAGRIVRTVEVYLYWELYTQCYLRKLHCRASSKVVLYITCARDPSMHAGVPRHTFKKSELTKKACVLNVTVVSHPGFLIVVSTPTTSTIPPKTLSFDWTRYLVQRDDACYDDQLMML